MKYGCIGEHLRHSFSKEIHALIADYDYDIKEIPKNELDDFMTEHDFLAINVTIPYKEAVIPHLYYIDEGARLIGAVNTVVNRHGKLYGYNTDFYGMNALAAKAGIDFRGKKVIILGTGGTSKTAYAVAKANGAREIIKASRTPSDSSVLYQDVYEYHTDAEIIINTTPVGMFPNIFGKPIEISEFPMLSGVIDAVYNPNKTQLIAEAKARGICAEGGLFMLVAQAVRASEIFLGTEYPSKLLYDVFKKIEAQKINIVLIGMPASGKTTVGNILAKKLRRDMVDTDDVAVKIAGTDIQTVFATKGEAAFRDIETQAVFEAAALSGIVIATGGGAILREENVKALRQNGKIYFIDRPLEALIPTDDRPTASTRAEIEQRYNERYEIYRASADVIIDASLSAEEVADMILKDFNQD